MKIQKFERIDNVEKLSSIIFTNFIDLQYQGGVEFTIDSIKNNLTSSGLLGWFLVNGDNKIIGYVIGDRQNLKDGRYVYYISYFFIIPKYRNHGLGKKMLINCMKYIESINIKFVLLTSEINTNAFKLYKSIGFIYDPIIKINNPKFTALIHYFNETTL
jgi:ribosomal protein S18 acetylase RimI-like enzyme